MQIDSPFAVPELIDSLAGAEREVGEFFGSLTADEFVTRPGTAWTPAEHLQHLIIAVGAVAGALAVPDWVLRIRFGRPRRPSRRYEEVRDDYRARLAAGAGATGRFVPAQEEIPAGDGVLRRTHLLSRWYRVNERMRERLAAWTERNLDRIQLPHPVLGKLTAREMTMFTIYHNRHHIAAAKRRLPRDGS